MKQINLLTLSLTAAILSSCAVGSITSATAGASVWALRANTATELTVEGEARLIKRIQRQLMQPKPDVVNDLILILEEGE
jgi:hypothetical protein